MILKTTSLKHKWWITELSWSLPLESIIFEVADRSIFLCLSSGAGLWINIFYLELKWTFFSPMLDLDPVVCWTLGHWKHGCGWEWSWALVPWNEDYLLHLSREAPGTLLPCDRRDVVAYYSSTCNEGVASLRWRVLLRPKLKALQIFSCYSNTILNHGRTWHMMIKYRHFLQKTPW